MSVILNSLERGIALEGTIKKQNANKVIRRQQSGSAGDFPIVCMHYRRLLSSTISSSQWNGISAGFMCPCTTSWSCPQPLFIAHVMQPRSFIQEPKSKRQGGDSQSLISGIWHQPNLSLPFFPVHQLMKCFYQSISHMLYLVMACHLLNEKRVRDGVVSIKRRLISKSYVRSYFMGILCFQRCLLNLKEKLSPS